MNDAYKVFSPYAMNIFKKEIFNKGGSKLHYLKFRFAFIQPRGVTHIIYYSFPLQAILGHLLMEAALTIHFLSLCSLRHQQSVKVLK